MALAPARQRLLTLMQATIADEQANHSWTYAEVRPLATPVRPWKPKMKVRGDCSKGVQWLAWWAKAPDPMQNGFGPYGNSQTIWSVLHPVDTPAELEVGDLVTFGYNGNKHAAMVMEPGPDPLLWSFGHQGAPDAYRLSQDKRPHQLRKLPVPDPPPSPQEKLRAMTGWFSWVAWRLGEGPWKPYGALSKAVRPAVPKLIPPLWWGRLAQFLADRKKGG